MPCLSYLEISYFRNYSVDDAHLQIVQVVRDVYLIIMRVDQTSFAWAEVHEGVMVISLLFSKSICLGDSHSIIYYESLKWSCLIFTSLESLRLVSVILVAYCEFFPCLYLFAESVASKTCYVNLEYFALRWIIDHYSVGDLETRVDELDLVFRALQHSLAVDFDELAFRGFHGFVAHDLIG